MVKRINDNKNIHLCPASVKGKYIIRFAICAKSTTIEDIDYSWTEIRRLGDQILLENQETKFKIMSLQQTPAQQQNQLTIPINNGIKLNGIMSTPACLNRTASEMSVVNLPRLNDIKTAYTNLLEAAGEDVNREGLLKTPERAAKAFEFFTAGYHHDLKRKFINYFSINIYS